MPMLPLTRRQLLRLGVSLAAGIGFKSRLFGQQQSHRSSDGLVEIDLEAGENWVGLAGGSARLFTYNRHLPAPIIEANPGDTVRINFTNNLPEPTNLHFHGLHISPSGNADNSFLEIPAGESMTYEFTLPTDHQGGTFWYHPHFHGLVAKQVSRGLAGVFVVRGTLDQIPEIAATPEYFLLLQDFDLTAAGEVREPNLMEQYQGREGSLLTVNGQVNPKLRIQKNGWARLRIVNASSSRFYWMRLEDHLFYLIATDGGAISAPRGMDEILLAPGERVEVLIEGNRPEGTYQFLSLPYNRGSMGMMEGMGMGRMASRGSQFNQSSEARVLATLVYQDHSNVTWSLPTALVTVDSLLPTELPVRRFIMGQGRNMSRGMSFTINGRVFNHDRIDTRVRLNTVEEWEIINPGPMDHPFHVHINAFQVLGSDGLPEPAWKDVVLVKAGSSVRLRTSFSDYTGTTMYHCHILDHEDLGMMATLEISQ